MTAVLERHAINAGVRIGQSRLAELAPCLAVVIRPRFDDLSLAAAHQRLESSSLMEKDGRLNHAELFAVIDRISAPPRLAEVGGVFEVDAPAVVFGTGRAEQFAVADLDWLVLDWPHDAVWQPPRLAPSLPAVLRSNHHSPPLARAGADFIKEQQRPCLRP